MQHPQNFFLISSKLLVLHFKNKTIRIFNPGEKKCQRLHRYKWTRLLQHSSMSCFCQWSNCKYTKNQLAFSETQFLIWFTNIQTLRSEKFQGLSHLLQHFFDSYCSFIRVCFKAAGLKAVFILWISLQKQVLHISNSKQGRDFLVYSVAWSLYVRIYFSNSS